MLGLGHVGTTVAVAFACAGLRVHGVDHDASRALAVAAGRLPFDDEEPELTRALADAHASGRLTASTSLDDVRDAGVVLVCVETPTAPAFEALRACCTQLGAVLRRGALVIVEATVAPGTMGAVVRPLIEAASGYTEGVDFLLGHCAERVMPGRLLANLRRMPRVCGGSPAATRRMVALYRAVVEGELDETDWVTAELTKTAENTHRDVAIAFANQLALACERAGADFLAVRALVEKIGDRRVLEAGAGVGGQCMPKDPWLFHAACDPSTPSLVPAARAINEAMPDHVVALVEEALGEAKVALDGARVALLGMSYKPGSAEARRTPSLVVRDRLLSRGVEVRAHDPCVAAFRGDLATVLEGADAAVLLVAHDAYVRLSPADLARPLRSKVLVDARLVFDPAGARAAGLVFRGVGRGR